MLRDSRHAGLLSITAMPAKRASAQNGFHADTRFSLRYLRYQVHFYKQAPGIRMLPGNQAVGMLRASPKPPT